MSSMDYTVEPHNGPAQKSPPLCEGINVRGPRLRMPPEASDPVIKVVHRNEQDIWLPCPIGYGGKQPNRYYNPKKAHIQTG